MGDAEKKGFVGSKAFWLILLWIILGAALSGAVYAARPRMDNLCKVWDAAVPDPALPHELQIEIAEGKFKSNCDAAEEKELLIVKGEKTHVSSHPNLTAGFTAILKMPWGTAWALPNFLILVTVLWHFGRGPAGEQLKTRRDELVKAIAEAQKARAEAEAKKKEYDELMAGIGGEIEALRKSMRSEGEAEQARLIAEAGRQAERIKNEAEFTAKQEVLMAQYRLRETAARLAVEVAEKVIRETITGEDRERLLTEYLEKVREQRT